MDKIDKPQKINKTILEQAKEFLIKNIEKENFVLESSEIESRKLREYLISNDLLYSPCKGIYIIKNQETPNNQVLEQNYFKILAKKGGVITGKLALNYHLGKNKKEDIIEVINGTKNSTIAMGKYEIKNTKSTINRKVERVKINGANLLIENNISYLINNFSKTSLMNEDYRTLLDSTLFMLEDIKEMINNGSSIINLSSMALYYKEKGNIRNYSLIKAALTQTGKGIDYNGKKKIEKDDTSSLNDLFKSTLTPGVDKKDIINDVGNPKILRFKKFINKLDNQCDKILSNYDLSNITLRSKNEILENIEEQIVYDSYHSLTIEEYKVTKEDIKILNEYSNEKEVNEIENKLIIKGYLKAYKKIKKAIEIDYGSKGLINKNFVLDLNNTLFSEVGLAKGFNNIQKDFRKHNVEITGTTHIPTSHDDLQDFMNEYFEYINNIKINSKKDIIKKAIMGHFLFTYIHPFGDGNGRTARFLMNHQLGLNKINWITILSETKNDYIKGLKDASENEDIEKFTKYILKYIN